MNSSRGKIDLTIVDVEMMINDSHVRLIPRFPRETHYQNKIIGESEIREDTSGSGIYLPISQALITAT